MSFASLNQIFVKRPLLTNMLQTGLLFGSGDFLAQSLFPAEDFEHYDFVRTARVVTYGGVIFAPLGLKWYRTLNAIKPFKTNAYNTLTRVACDQLLFAPFVAIPLYYTSISALELNPDPIGEAKRKLEQFWWTTLRNNWTVWPAFQYINFALVPPPYKLLAVNLFSIGWNTYLSWLLNTPHHVLKEEPEQLMI